MQFLCLAGAHAPHPSKGQNQGLHFSSCRRCGRDMVRSEAKWKPVPDGFRIVWKKVERAKPVTRNLAAVAAPRIGQIYDAHAADRGQSRRAHRSTLLQLALVGLKLFVWYGADSLAKWRKELAARRFAPRSPMRLLSWNSLPT